MSLLDLIKPKAPATDVAQPATTPRATGETLEDVLLELAKWGRPSVYCGREGGWRVSVEVNITPTGAKFEVASEFGHKTPTVAALECRERLMASVKAIGGAA
jgi:hypothetical protein